MSQCLLEIKMLTALQLQYSWKTEKPANCGNSIILYGNIDPVSHSCNLSLLHFLWSYSIHNSVCSFSWSLTRNGSWCTINSWMLKGMLLLLKPKIASAFVLKIKGLNLFSAVSDNFWMDLRRGPLYIYLPCCLKILTTQTMSILHFKGRAK